MKPRLLDLFCGAGGAAMGYHRAGFEVVGVDIESQPNYPFEFIQGDVLDPLVWHALHAWDSETFDAIHASPPCQAYTTMSNRWRGSGGKADTHDALIAEVRAGLEATGLPYVIENVMGARRDLRNPIVLNGGAFGLRVDRPRLFECSFSVMSWPRQPVTDPIGVYGKSPDGRLLFRRQDGTEQRAASSVEEARAAMGIHWMTWDELREAIPPAYTEHIGSYLLEEVRRIQAGVAA